VPQETQSEKLSEFGSGDIDNLPFFDGEEAEATLKSVDNEDQYNEKIDPEEEWDDDLDS
jgi:hypothetical protein